MGCIVVRKLKKEIQRLGFRWIVAHVFRFFPGHHDAQLLGMRLV